MTGAMVGIFILNESNGFYHEYCSADVVQFFEKYAEFNGASERRLDKSVRTMESSSLRCTLNLHHSLHLHAHVHSFSMT